METNVIIEMSAANNQIIVQSANAATAATAPSSECAVCCEPFNKSTHARVVCEYGSCNYNACIECIRTYLLSSINEAHCMDCKQPWSPKFMLVLKKNWLAETYRTHREKLLCDIELSKIAETMPAVEFYKRKKRVEAEETELQKQLLHEERELIHKYTNQRNEIFRKLRESRSRKAAVQTQAGTPASKEEKKVFFMSCPAMDCKGMLSTQYKCGLCEKYACHECHEIIGETKTDAHTCDPNNVASAQAIKKETRQCPGCHNRIYRIEGCSQMWCTGCHTAFDWNTGKKVSTDRLHNPHWLEYQRSQNNGVAPRAPGDVPCGGLCGYSEFNRFVLGKLASDYLQIRMYIKGMFRFLENVVLNELRITREQVQALRDFEILRLDYIIGDISKEDMSAKIYGNDKARQKNTELLNVYELLAAVGIDVFRRLSTSTNSKLAFRNEVRDQIIEYDKLRIYCNGLFATISNTYALSVPQISEYWTVERQKFNGKTLGILLAQSALAGPPMLDEIAPESASAAATSLPFYAIN